MKTLGDLMAIMDAVYYKDKDHMARGKIQASTARSQI
jgi:hypothetical protein